MTTVAQRNADWLKLIEVNGPFLALPVINDALEHGPERTDPDLRVELRGRLKNLSENTVEQAAWVDWVLADLLEFGDRLHAADKTVADHSHFVDFYNEMLRPDRVVVGPPVPGSDADDIGRLLINRYEPGTNLYAPLRGDRRANLGSPVERMETLCRASGVELGLVTDGNVFVLVWAREGEVAGTGAWVSEWFTDDPAHLDSFVTLLGSRRFFAGAPDETLEALLARSQDGQEDVTAQLGKQAREATELLVAAISRANLALGAEAVRDISPHEVYRAAVTVMMRLIFLLYAEERGLLPVESRMYRDNYAVSSLRGELEELRRRDGDETLERRSTAWHRLLATFRAVYGGIQHEDLRIPPYGGSLFDPDRYPFLEGRDPGTGWQTMPAQPIPIDDLTVSAILNALQVLEFRDGGVTEARTITFRSLDVEQIGHVYEGLLNHDALRADTIVLGLSASKARTRAGLEPETLLDEIEAVAATGRQNLVSFLGEQTGLSEKAVEKRLDVDLDSDGTRLLRTACDNEDPVIERVRPYAGLLRQDLRGLPLIYSPGSVYVTETSSRRDSGTEYTTKDLADEVARYTLEPLVYSPGPADTANESEWRLKSSVEILSLRIADPAVGSGAIIVAACRYLGDMLIEAWIDEEAPQVDEAGTDIDELITLARRAVADQCLYGVDRDEMAVEMAKLSLWLVTMSKDRPFSFLDHAFKSGDSLLGVTNLDQIEYLHVDPATGRKIHGTLFDYTASLQPLVKQAIAKRRELESIHVRTVRDAQEKGRLNDEANRYLDALRVIGDVVVGAALSTAQQKKTAIDQRLRALAPAVAGVFGDTGVVDEAKLAALASKAAGWLNEGRPNSAPVRKCLHWPIEFPEVFEEKGFDGIVGNPPFLGGTLISGPNGRDFRHYLARYIAGFKTDRADLCSFFFRRAASLTRVLGSLGLLATQGIKDGSSRVVGLEELVTLGFQIHRAVPNRPWPGAAAVHIAEVWMWRGDWAGQCVLGGAPVRRITTHLDPGGRVEGEPHRLASNQGMAIQGAKPSGRGFILDAALASTILARDDKLAEVVRPYLTGSDLNATSDARGRRYIVDFRDWSRSRAGSYAAAFEIVEERLPAERAGKKAWLSENFWLFEHPAMAMRQMIEGLDVVIAIAYTSNTLAFRFAPVDQVFGDSVVVFGSNSDNLLGHLSSSMHFWWVARYGTAMKGDARYQVSRCFESYPFPVDGDSLHSVDAAAGALRISRFGMMKADGVGLTSIYRRVNSPGCDESGIVELRDLHKRLDRTVAGAYGWDDLELNHGHWETPQGVRWTVEPSVAREIIDRLLELNHERFAEEVEQGLHDQGASQRSSQSARDPKKMLSGQTSMLTSEEGEAP